LEDRPKVGSAKAGGQQRLRPAVEAELVDVPAPVEDPVLPVFVPAPLATDVPAPMLPPLVAALPVPDRPVDPAEPVLEPDVPGEPDPVDAVEPAPAEPDPEAAVLSRG
jgi:hypothetical protein